MKSICNIGRARKLAGGMLVFGALMSGGQAQAIPVQFGNNYYEYIDAAGYIAWSAADTAATGMSYLGVSGHLATVTSAAENDFLYSLINPYPVDFTGAWLGGYVDSSNAGIWVVGPEAGTQFSQGHSAYGGAYANWGGVEPNNAPSYVYMNIADATYSGIGAGQWADAINGRASGADPVTGYFVEYEVTPLPAALPLFVSGLGAMGILAWRRRRKRAAAIA